MSSALVEPSVIDPPLGDEPGSGERLVLRDILNDFERNLIATVLFAAGGNQKRAAEALGVLPTTFQEKLKRFGFINHRFGQRTRGKTRGATRSETTGPHREASPTPQENLRK